MVDYITLKLKDLLVSEENQENLICLVCIDILYLPVECKICKINICLNCAEYLNTCKRRCINENFEKKHFIDYDCPVDLTDALTLKCSNPGCEEQIQLKDLPSHLLNCQHLIRNCPFKNCTFTGKEEDISSHVNLCNLSNTKCYLCGESVSLGNRQTHNGMNKYVEEMIKLNDLITTEYDKNMKIITLLTVSIKAFLKEHSIISTGKCKKCFDDLTWLKNSYISGVTSCSSSNCLRNYRFWCQTCKIKYCVVCAKPPCGGTCGCGVKQVLKELFSNTCDICREHISPKGYRCQGCDFDVCLQCYSGN